ncbi:MAG: polyhydroxyalkanoate biosynthesis repressor PhaR [Clostridiales bacterium]|nr:polyhydroxyalkanoate biosynthesis repressor PhaR [Clostridiales bacterium]
MAKSIDIAGRKVGLDYAPLVIAEIGINHGGSLQVAKEMVDAASRAGIEIVKHQTHIVDCEMSDEAKKVIPGNSDQSIYHIMERCSLNEADEIALQKYVESKGMIFISTPFSFAAVDRLEKMGVPAYKIGSGEMNNYKLVEYIASKGKPVILSTGMNDLASVKKAVEAIRKHHDNYAILHTTNLYPTPPHLVRLNALEDIKKEFEGDIIGLSDHTLTNSACICAMAMGASIVERHFTDRMDRVGEDIVCSMDEIRAGELVQASKDVFQMRGGHKDIIPEEQVTRDFAYNTIVLAVDVKAGETLTADKLTTKRPGNIGIHAEQFDSIVGRVVNKDIQKNKHLTYEDLR